MLVWNEKLRINAFLLTKIIYAQENGCMKLTLQLSYALILFLLHCCDLNTTEYILCQIYCYYYHAP